MWIKANDRLVNLGQALTVDIESNEDGTCAVVAKFPTHMVTLFIGTPVRCRKYLVDTLKQFTTEDA